MEDLGSVSEVQSPSEERARVLPEQGVLQLQKNEEGEENPWLRLLSSIPSPGLHQLLSLSRLKILESSFRVQFPVATPAAHNYRELCPFQGSFIGAICKTSSTSPKSLPSLHERVASSGPSSVHNTDFKWLWPQNPCDTLGQRVQGQGCLQLQGAGEGDERWMMSVCTPHRALAGYMSEEAR